MGMGEGGAGHAAVFCGLKKCHGKQKEKAHSLSYSSTIAHSLKQPPTTHFLKQDMETVLVCSHVDSGARTQTRPYLQFLLMRLWLSVHTTVVVSVNTAFSLDLFSFNWINSTYSDPPLANITFFCHKKERKWDYLDILPCWCNAADEI